MISLEVYLFTIFNNISRKEIKGKIIRKEKFYKVFKINKNRRRRRKRKRKIFLSKFIS
jgi:hypothetical protein